jgi:RNA polymerase sigma factor (sigma-70 family)
MSDPERLPELLAQAQAGDTAAIEALLKAIRPWLEQIAAGHAGRGQPDGGTSDLVQQAWLRAWHHLGQFHGGTTGEETVARFRAWLARIVRRLAGNAQRARAAAQRRPPGTLVRLDAPATGSAVEPPAGDPTPSACAAADEEEQRLHDALARIEDETDRTILRLRFFEGLSLRQIALRLGTNHEQVRQRCHAALRRLERDLGRPP